MDDDLDTPPHLRQAARAGDGSDDAQRSVATGRIGSRPQLTVAFVRQDGTADAFSYAHLYRVRSDGGTVLRAEFTAHVVTVEGRGLGRLLRYLCDHKASVVREADGGEERDFDPDGAERVNRISVERLAPE